MTVLAVLAIGPMTTDVKIAAHHGETVATVVEFDPGPARGPLQGSATVQFTAGSSRVVESVDVALWNATPERGDRLAVDYALTDPSAVRLAPVPRVIAVMAPFLALAVIALLLWCGFLARAVLVKTWTMGRRTRRGSASAGRHER